MAQKTDASVGQAGPGELQHHTGLKPGSNDGGDRHDGDHWWWGLSRSRGP